MWKRVFLKISVQNPDDSEQGLTIVSEITAEKVIAYITCGDKLLVFSHPRYPEAGIQVPAGTVEEGEPLEEAVLREAREETGLKGLRTQSYLGVREYDLSAFDLYGVHLQLLGLKSLLLSFRNKCKSSLYPLAKAQLLNPIYFFHALQTFIPRPPKDS